MALLDINLKAVDECDFTNTSETDHSAQFYRTVLTIKIEAYICLQRLKY